MIRGPRFGTPLSRLGRRQRQGANFRDCFLECWILPHRIHSHITRGNS